MAATCKRWRQVNITSPVVNESVSSKTRVRGVMTEDEQLQSFALWLTLRAHLVSHLDYHHQDSISHNELAADALSLVSDRLGTLKIDNQQKHTQPSWPTLPRQP